MKIISFISGVRDLKSNISRFISIFAIAAIGVGFFAGVRAAKPDMTESANMYFEAQKLMDFSITSVEGFTDDDVNMIKEQVDSTVVKSYAFDAVSKVNDSDFVIKYYSLSNKINIPDIVDGRFPTSPDECIADANSIWLPLNVGDEIYVDNNNNPLKKTKLKVVGLVDTGLYISGTQYGSTNLGKGQVDTAVFLNQDAFEGEYNTLFVRCNFLRKYNCYSDDYKTKLDAAIERLDYILSNRLKDIISGTYDYRKLDLSKYDPQLVDITNHVYDEKEALEKEYNNLVTTKEYLDRTGELINKKSIGYQQTLLETETYIAEEVSKYDADREKVAKLRSECEKAEAEFEAVNKQYESLKQQVEDKQQQMNAMPDKTVPGYVMLQNEVNAKLVELDSLSKQVAEKRAIAVQKGEVLNTAFNEYDSAYASADKIFGELNNKNQITADELVKMTISYRSAQIDYNTRLQEYDKAREELTNKLKDTVDAVSKIYSNYDSLWFYNDRFDFPGNAEYGDNADRIGNIATVFPTFFLIVAMLVCLTAMTRLVSDHRLQIGTLKALGYSNTSIALRYISYALVATVLGCGVGLCVGFVLFPRVILYAYSMLYSINVIYTPFRLDIAIVSSLLMCICIVFSVVLACYSEFTNTPSKLMRPKSAPAGKRIFLDRISFVWNKLTFTQKVSARNMFIHKKRKIMTVVGVAGCTALLLTGFGLRDSVSDIIENQYNNIWNYQLTAYFSDANEAQKLVNINGVDESFICYQKSHEVISGDNMQEAYVVIPKDDTQIGNFINLKNRKNSSKYNLIYSNCLITEKLAKLLGVNKGGTITLSLNGESVNVKVDAIVENYAYHYVYLSNRYYNELTKDTPEYNTMLCKCDTKVEDDVAESLLESGKVLGVSLNSDSKNTFEDIITLLNIVIMVLIISAGALSFVVVYNLSDINITERKREIATLKVLGFTKKEMYKYVLGENTLLSLIGTAVGLGLGYLLAMYVITTAEIDVVMFGRTIYPLSFGLSALLSVLFTLIISFAMRPKLNKVDMIESLKSVE